MKFTLLATLALATHATSLPAVEKRQSSAIKAISGDISTATTAVNGDLSTICSSSPQPSLHLAPSNNPTASAIQKSAKDVSAQAALTATVNADLKNIVTQLQKAGTAIGTSTTGLTTTLTAPEISALTSAVTAAQTLVKNIQTTLATDSGKLMPGKLLSTLLCLHDVEACTNKGCTTATRTAVSSELKAVTAAIQSLTTPLTTYSKAVASVGTSSGTSGASNLQSLVNQLVGIVNGLLSSLGLGGTVAGATGATGILGHL